MGGRLASELLSKSQEVLLPSFLVVLEVQMGDVLVAEFALKGFFPFREQSLRVQI